MRVGKLLRCSMHQCEERLEVADALVIITEWREFWQPDFSMLAQSLW